MASTKTNDSKTQGHGEDSKAPSVSKGTFEQVGTYAPLAGKAVSVNQKSGHAGGGEEG